MPTFVEDHIPDEATADMIADGFKAQTNPEATSVDKTEEDDGTWTVTAVFP